MCDCPSSAEILVSVDRFVATVTFNRPAKLNALTPEMAATLIDVVDWCDRSNEVRVVVFTGAGEKAFSAGSDISTLASYATPWDFRNRVDYCDAIRRSRKPAIAAINGYALGGGLETALSCDIRIASERAHLGAPEIKLGWIGGGGMAALLSAAAGPSNAALMLMTGEPITAENAREWHLVSEVVPHEELLDRAREIAAIIARRAPIAAETAKVNLRALAGMSVEQSLQYERDLQAICFATADAREGRRAFAEKRDPTFTRS